MLSGEDQAKVKLAIIHNVKVTLRTLTYLEWIYKLLSIRSGAILLCNVVIRLICEHKKISRICIRRIFHSINRDGNLYYFTKCPWVQLFPEKTLLIRRVLRIVLFIQDIFTMSISLMMNIQLSFLIKQTSFRELLQTFLVNWQDCYVKKLLLFMLMQNKKSRLEWYSCNVLRLVTLYLFTYCITNLKLRFQ